MKVNSDENSNRDLPVGKIPGFFYSKCILVIIRFLLIRKNADGPVQHILIKVYIVY